MTHEKWRTYWATGYDALVYIVEGNIAFLHYVQNYERKPRLC